MYNIYTFFIHSHLLIIYKLFLYTYIYAQIWLFGSVSDPFLYHILIAKKYQNSKTLMSNLKSVHNHCATENKERKDNKLNLKTCN